MVRPSEIAMLIGYDTVAGAQVFENFTDVSSYFYDPVKMELVSYDTPDIVTLKAQYINSKGLAGSMFQDVNQSYFFNKGSKLNISALIYIALDR